MNREVHVRFCEGVGVSFPRATRPVVERVFRSVKHEGLEATAQPMATVKATVIETLGLHNPESFERLSLTMLRPNGYPPPAP